MVNSIKCQNPFQDTSCYHLHLLLLLLLLLDNDRIIFLRRKKQKVAFYVSFSPFRASFLPCFQWPSTLYALVSYSNGISASHRPTWTKPWKSPFLIFFVTTIAIFPQSISTCHNKLKIYSCISTSIKMRRKTSRGFP